jgi:hypothetical protein
MHVRDAVLRVSGLSVDAAAVREPHVELRDPLALGADVARFGDDQSVIYICKGRDGRTFLLIKLLGVDTMTLAAGCVADLYQQHQADGLFVDGGGVGAGVVDRLRQLGLPVFDVQFITTRGPGVPLWKHGREVLGPMQREAAAARARELRTRRTTEGRRQGRTKACRRTQRARHSRATRRQMASDQRSAATASVA